MDVLPIVSTFLLILVSELGDKTQLAVISLSSNYRASHVFAGAMLAFLAVDGVSLAIGGTLLAFLPIRLVLIISGSVFIIFGVLPWLTRDKNETKGCLSAEKSKSLPILACFSLVSLMELGDKTQLITITLAAETHPLLVLIGITLAFTVLTGVAVLMGAKLLSLLPTRWLKIGTSALFIIIGVVSILSGIFEFTIL
ncbi:TMEM165/GDT1 family protein [Candidatus Bathyarchaeota archaeon A05DMB-2]|jgi:putative Ca2+/H+ antiporter (TMEM165/GDT1 family)|nr:TMEM165/GDT1 family protein [Candidatus Bathyarchaeota archaeon A05DMB-2]